MSHEIERLSCTLTLRLLILGGVPGSNKVIYFTTQCVTWYSNISNRTSSITTKRWRCIAQYNTVYLSIIVETVTSYCHVWVLDITIIIWRIIIIKSTKLYSSLLECFISHILSIDSINIPVEIGATTITRQCVLITKADGSRLWIEPNIYMSKKLKINNYIIGHTSIVAGAC